MAKDLTSSAYDRQNILNNSYALKHAESHLALGGIEFNGERIFTKNQLMILFDVSDTTIERYINNHLDELKSNGYTLLKGKTLKDFKEIHYGTLINEGTKTSVIGIFKFKSVLNLAMLLVESEQARIIRTRILDIVLDTLAERSGGHTKFINQRDEDYLVAAFKDESYRKKFTDALDKYVDGNQWKYSKLTNSVYQAIFHENAAEYRDVLKLHQKDKIRDTMYSEVLTLISSFEVGLAHEIEQKAKTLGRKLKLKEAEEILKIMESHPLYEPMLIDVRTKMASRDLCFRDALHEKLEAYVKAVPPEDFERFLGEKSKSLEERLSDPEMLEVFKRLKDR
ncbi:MULTISPECIES: DNA-binding protein [Proteus]|uniref:DNA-binding protein n=1 Tax=Proteus TaxID=583 RepID=UPI001B828D95|nr:DNA-binding protein [Proteus mirabilis]MCW4517805.1 DNA-binding protein [Proteus mirabilis]UZE74371.1 DNA-binding protein [Proteus mirabilis]UZE78061.1 DNA-binding protein [Proteus mirabilis]UZE81763.1 DNA-binding protein [Proteus mirabilis]HBC2874066.1 DNA-binding protein [Proteus mirabilis]